MHEADGRLTDADGASLEDRGRRSDLYTFDISCARLANDRLGGGLWQDRTPLLSPARTGPGRSLNDTRPRKLPEGLIVAKFHSRLSTIRSLHFVAICVYICVYRRWQSALCQGFAERLPPARLCRRRLALPRTQPPGAPPRRCGRDVTPRRRDRRARAVRSARPGGTRAAQDRCDARTTEGHVSAMRPRDLYLFFAIQKVSPKCLLLALSRCQVILWQNACGGYSRGGHSQKSRRREKLISMGDSGAAASAPSFSPNGLRSMSAKHAHGSPPSPGAARHRRSGLQSDCAHREPQDMQQVAPLYERMSVRDVLTASDRSLGRPSEDGPAMSESVDGWPMAIIILKTNSGAHLSG